MKPFTVLFFYLFTCAASAQCSQEYMKEINEPMFMQYGDTNYIWFSCDTSAVVMHVSDRFYDKMKVRSAAAREDFIRTMMESYTYLFRQKGFSSLTVFSSGQKMTKPL